LHTRSIPGSPDTCHSAMQKYLQNQFNFPWKRLIAYGPYSDGNNLWYRSTEKIPGLTYVSQDHVSIDPKVSFLAQRFSGESIIKKNTRVEFVNVPVQQEDLTIAQMMERGASVSELHRKSALWKKNVDPSSYIILGDLVVSVGSLRNKDWPYFSHLEAHNGTKDIQLLKEIVASVPITVWDLGKRLKLPVPEVKRVAKRLGFVVGSSVIVDSDKVVRGSPALSDFGWEDFFRDD